VKTDVSGLLPEGAIANCAVIAVSYLDADGEMRYGVETQGDVPVSTSIGLLELVKMDLRDRSRVE
jgi:hypothetical protein